jgi:hypothetical protein
LGGGGGVGGVRTLKILIEASIFKYSGKYRDEAKEKRLNFPITCGARLRKAHIYNRRYETFGAYIFATKENERIFQTAIYSFTNIPYNVLTLTVQLLKEPTTLP